MMRAVQQAISHWGYVLPYVHVPHSEKDYEKLWAFADELMDWSRHHKNEHATSLLNLVAKNLEAYENRHYSTKSASALDMLKFLMDEHGLGQSDLPEIGGQSLISKILSGEWQLTLDHVRLLAKRFGVSPSVFI